GEGGGARGAWGEGGGPARSRRGGGGGGGPATPNSSWTKPARSRGKSRRDSTRTRTEARRERSLRSIFAGLARCSGGGSSCAVVAEPPRSLGGSPISFAPARCCA